MANFVPDTLLMLSGGLDSTGALWHLIENKKKIHIHHMNLKNLEKRGLAESIAVKEILKFIDPKCDYYFSESSHAYETYNNQFMWDSDISSFMAGSICMMCPSIKEVAIGMTASDTAPGMEDRIERAMKIFKAFGSKAVKVYPVGHLTKQEIYDMMPKELSSLTWSCRTPSYKDYKPIACEKCKSCKEIQGLKR